MGILMLLVVALLLLVSAKMPARLRGDGWWINVHRIRSLRPTPQHHGILDPYEHQRSRKVHVDFSKDPNGSTQTQ